MYVDTHSHLYLDDFTEDFDAIIERCNLHEVERIYLPNIDTTTMSAVDRLVESDPARFYGMMGLHPCYVKENYSDVLKKIYKHLTSNSYVGVGEIGIDLYWDKTHYKEQQDAFERQIAWSREMELPFVIHSRESLDLTIATVEKMQDGKLSGIFHCFGGDEDQAKRIIDLGFYLGIGGVLTFKNAGLDKIVEKISLEHLVLETDAPYLTPTPFRGKRNESSYIQLVGKKLAECKGITEKEVMEKTTANANKVFNYTPL